MARNLVTGGADRALTGALSLLVVPFHVSLLGIEGYGVLSFVTSLQVLTNIIDFGLGPTIVRELAGDVGADRTHSRRVVQTFGVVYWTIALILGITVASAAPHLADSWLQLHDMPRHTVIATIHLTAASILIRWPIALYAGAITGAQRLDIVNVTRIGASVVRIIGGLIVMWASRTLVAYMAWLVLIGFIELCVYAAVAGRLLGPSILRPRLATSIVRRVWSYSAQMNMISILAALFVQGDRLAISKLRSVSELGHYALAYNIVSGITIVPAILTTALFPQLARDLSLGKNDDVRNRCQTVQQVLMYIVSGLAGFLVFWGGDVLSLIAPDARSANVAMIILTAGFFFAAAIAVPYTVAIAAGDADVPLRVNAAAAVIYIPSIYALVTVYGIEGAAFGWLMLNAYYAAVMVPLLQRRLPLPTSSAWLARTIVPFAVCAVAIMGAGRWIGTFADPGDMPSVTIALVSGLAYTLVGARLLHENTRLQILGSLGLLAGNTPRS